jgi:hypothetical protein
LIHLEGCQGGNRELDRQETQGAMEVQRQAMGLLKEILCRKSRELIKLSRNQLSMHILMGLATGHCYLKQHVFKPGLVHSPMCERCQLEPEMASHILCDCKALAN